MAPSATETLTATERASSTFKVHAGDYKEIFAAKFKEEDERKGTGEHAPASYPNYLPTWNPEQKYPPLEPFDHNDVGKNADTTYPEILGAGASVSDITPTTGTEIRGVQLSKLSEAGKAQLAHLVAKRKVVAFRDQDFAALPIPEALDYGSFFGRHHIHPTSGSPEGHPEVHLIHRSAGDTSVGETLFSQRTSSVAWHSDVTYEEQPPGTTFLYALDVPSTGGDTLFANAAEAYDRLSEPFKERLHGLQAVHSGIEQINASLKRGSIKRREPVANVHPIVRTHPATGEKALYVNPQFTRNIVGLKKEESDYLLKFLYDHIAYGADFHVRVKWEKGTVVVWDNRVTQHSALVDWRNGERRHIARITPQAERPFETRYNEA